MTGSRPESADAACQLARELLRRQRPGEAAELCRLALQLEPDHVDALTLGAVLALQGRDAHQAVALLDRALRGAPDNPAIHYYRGNGLRALGAQHAAIASYDAAIALNPELLAAHHNRANAWRDLGEFAAALAGYDAILAMRPDFVPALKGRADALQELRQDEASLASYDAAIALDPAGVELLNNRGNLLRRMGRPGEAVASYDAALALDAHNPVLFSNRGAALQDQGQHQLAMDSYARAVELDPERAEAHAGGAAAAQALGCVPEALAGYARAVAIRPDLVEAHNNLGNLQAALGDYGAALQSYDRAWALQPDLQGLAGMRLHAKMQLHDWHDMDARIDELTAALGRGVPVANPFTVLALPAAAELPRRCAEVWARASCPQTALPGTGVQAAAGARLRIGYFSADFCNHPVARLAVRMFELHDRARVEITAFSFGPPARDALRERLEPAFDRFLAVGTRSDREIALLARSLGLDIAVDLGGYTERSRPGIFAYRAAPVQVSYLGYPETLGASFMDYLIADPIVVPSGAEDRYAEKLIRLPCFQVNDPFRTGSERRYSRDELGLPAQGCVFCCFNNGYKITPECFGSWMRILGRVPDSSLLLYAGSGDAQHNLRRAASDRGVDPRRLVFAPRVGYADYLARCRVADLFLDTLPFNAGATGSDALWAGLPVLTLAGATYCARMGASLLQAAGLPELVAHDRRHYEDLAVGLGSAPQRLSALRDRLLGNRATAPLFDTQRFVTCLERAYAGIAARSRAGLAPAHIEVLSA